MDADGKERTGHRKRLRERFLLGEASSRTDEALLELLLSYGIPQRDVQPLAESLIARFGDLNKVLAADPAALCSVDGVESHVSTLLKLVGYIGQTMGTPRPSSELQGHPGPVLAPALPAPERPGPGSVTSVPLAQSEMPLNLPGQSDLPLAPKAPAVRERKTIQDVLLAEGLLALNVAHEAKSLEELQDILVKRLGQNSMETRRRYAQSIVRGVKEGVFGYTSVAVPTLGPDGKYQVALAKVRFETEIADDEVDLESGFILMPQAIPQPAPVTPPAPGGKPGQPGQPPQPGTGPAPVAPGTGTGPSVISETATPATGAAGQKVVELIFTADRDGLFAARNALANLADMSGKVAVTVRAESEQGFDKSKLQNGVLEPLKEADLIQ